MRYCDRFCATNDAKQTGHYPLFLITATVHRGGLIDHQIKDSAMEIIRHSIPGSDVKVSMKITGVIAWRYKYVADGVTFISKTSNPLPQPLPLGTAQAVDGD